MFQEIFESLSSTSGMDGMDKAECASNGWNQFLEVFRLIGEGRREFYGEKPERVEGIIDFRYKSLCRVFIDFIFGILFNDNSSHLNFVHLSLTQIHLQQL